ncbi:MAG: hypothetical protein AAGE43_03890 [Pseudomonadota bacterium]
MEQVLKWVFFACVALLPISCWQRDEFVPDMAILPVLAEEPVQKKVREDPFTVLVNDVAYAINPQYEYDLRGLVVSYEHHDGDRMLHRLWNDHLNVADLCVVWGSNASEIDLNDFDFWNGQFTCFFRTGDQMAWQRFDQNALSNNHLITEDEYLRDLIANVQVGDQIQLSGWLASYSHGEGFTRGTSTTRTDRGNGACETIYVKRFQILSSMDNGWRIVFKASLAGAIICMVIWVLVVARGGFRYRYHERPDY